MFRTFLPHLTAALLALSTIGSSSAASITGDFVDMTVSHGIGADFPGVGCKTYQNLGVAIGTGVEVGAANDVGGTCSGGISVDIDGDAFTITLNNADAGLGDYRWVEILINGIDLEDIAGVALVSNGVFTLLGAGTLIPDPAISFTDSSIRILFDPPGDGVFDVTPDTGASTVFSITTRALVVSEPASLALTGLALAGLAAIRRRKQ